MAEQKKSFPMLPISTWWALRKKFRQSIPGVVTDNYVSTVLTMSIRSVRNNVLPYLKTLGIIDDDGKTLERAKKWRDDEHYAEVCKEILEQVYPKELLDAVPNPSADRRKAERWFGNHTGAGESAVNRMTALYTVLVEGDVSKQPGQDKTKKSAKEPKLLRARVDATVPPAILASEPAKPSSLPQLQAAPGININLEIHISADSTPDQIDQIFASMAKHIYGRS